MIRSLFRVPAIPALALAGLFVAADVHSSSIPMPDGSRSWILVNSGDCDDDGPNNNVDRGHCIGAVSQLNVPGDIGHDHFTNYTIAADATIGPENFRGSITVHGGPFTFLDMAMIDTYTLQSATLPPGTPVEITVRFQGVATLTGFFNGLGFGGAQFGVRIGDGFQAAPIVIPENTRVTGNLGATASQQVFIFPTPSGVPIPLDLTATNTFTAQIGVPFDRSFYMSARPSNAEVDFHNTGTISFDLPAGVTVTSTGGFGSIVPVAPATWSAIKTRAH